MGKTGIIFVDLQKDFVVRKPGEKYYTTRIAAIEKLLQYGKEKNLPMIKVVTFYHGKDITPLDENKVYSDLATYTKHLFNSPFTDDGNYQDDTTQMHNVDFEYILNMHEISEAVVVGAERLAPENEGNLSAKNSPLCVEATLIDMVKSGRPGHTTHEAVFGWKKPALLFLLNGLQFYTQYKNTDKLIKYLDKNQ